MVTGSLSRRYAKAMFEIGTAQGDLAKLGQDIRSLAKAMKESAELDNALTNPALRRSDRRRIVEAVMQVIGVQTASRNLVYVLLDGERMANLPGISRALDEMIEAKAGRVTAEVVSAKPLNASQLSEINVALEKLSGKKVSVTTRQDPELLGGVIAKVGDTVYDGSLRTQLRAIRDELSK